MSSASQDPFYIQAEKPCPTAVILHAWIDTFLQLNIPRRAVCPGHDAPFDYLRRSYFEPARDLVVWAPRGGGKTRLGAAATLLDLLHKPGIAVRILGGSLEQSLKMWEHLLPDIAEYCKGRIDGKIGAHRVRLLGGACAAVLTQSQRAVRGLRVQKLRCDEVEMFDSDVWQAAQLVTKSAQLKRLNDEAPESFAVNGVVEAFSTCHRPGGLMEQIIGRAAARGAAVVKWCLLEVLEKCPAERDCAACPLFEDCRGIAKTRCDGFVSIDDAIAMKQRTSKETWDAEMMCRRPSEKGCVFGHFKTELHVREEPPPADPAQAAAVSAAAMAREGIYLGIDFGFRNPFVCLWIWRDRHGRSIVIDEYVREFVPLSRHIAAIQARGRGPVLRIGCDPAGSARNEQTGVSNIAELRAAGFKVGCKASRIADGLEIIRAALQSGTGEVSLFIHPRCEQLIQAMRAYRYGESRSEAPLKDGPDHLIDALRYYYINRNGGEVFERMY